MKRAITASLSILAAIALLGLSNATAADELYLIRDGKLIKESFDWPDPDRAKKLRRKGWVVWGGKTVDGLYVVDKRAKNYCAGPAKSALGDCEFKVVFSCANGRGSGGPGITIRDRGRLRPVRDGSQIYMSLRKQPLPLQGFGAPCPDNVYDGKLHSMALKRVGDKISFYYDDKQINEQPIDPDTHLYMFFSGGYWLGGWDIAFPKIKSMKLTAEKFSDKLRTDYKRAAPIEVIFEGTGRIMPSPEYGKACRYRIPALAVSTKGTILAFAEARRTGGADIGDIDTVVKRSEDGGKTWGPEIVIMDANEKSVNNPCPVVEPKTGRIWVCMGRWEGTTRTTIHISHSDDDGKTWARPKDVTKILYDQLEPGVKIYLPGPGAGIVLERGENAGRLVIPMGFEPLVVYSDDHGETWKIGGSGGSAMGEAQCVELCDGSVLFNGRTGQKKRALAIVPEGGTKDSDKTWYADELPDPSCQGAVARYSWPKDGKPGLILYSGPGIATARAQGTLRGSYDDGKTWPWKQQYYQGPSGYSDVAVLSDGRVIVLFEKDGKSDLGFTIVPAPPGEPPAEPAAKKDQ